MKRRYLGTLLLSMTGSAGILACDDVINGWPRGHAVIQGSAFRRGNVPYQGELFVSCDDDTFGATGGTRAPGEYRIELAPSFPAGVPADSVECDVRAVFAQPPFAATRRVLFVPLDDPVRTHILDVVEP